MAGSKCILEECGGLSVAMNGGTKTLQWFADSWARGEREPMHTHALRHGLFAGLCLPPPLTYSFRHRCQYNHHLPHKFTCEAAYRDLTYGKSVIEIWWEC